MDPRFFRKYSDLVTEAEIVEPKPQKVKKAGLTRNQSYVLKLKDGKSVEATFLGMMATKFDKSLLDLPFEKEIIGNRNKWGLSYRLAFKTAKGKTIFLKGGNADNYSMTPVLTTEDGQIVSIHSH
jgi:hypothetical protein